MYACTRLIILKSLFIFRICHANLKKEYPHRPRAPHHVSHPITRKTRQIKKKTEADSSNGATSNDIFEGKSTTNSASAKRNKQKSCAISTEMNAKLRTDCTVNVVRGVCVCLFYSCCRRFRLTVAGLMAAKYSLVSLVFQVPRLWMQPQRGTRTRIEF